MTMSIVRGILLFGLVLMWTCPAMAGTRWAILIGVNNYPKNLQATVATSNGPRNLSWPDLNYGVDDVRTLRDTLLNVGYQKENIVVIDSKASDPAMLPTHDNIVEQLSLLSTDDKFGKDDSVMVVFTGHGFTENGESLLCPSDIDINQLHNTGISVSLISERLAKAKVAQRYLIIDACRNEVSNIGLTQFNLLTGLQKLELQKRGDALPGQSTPQGIFYFASCLAGQRSVEDDELKHGVFLHFFTQGLTGLADVQPGGDRDRHVSPYEAFKYASEETRRWTRKHYSWDQQPWVEGRATEGLHLAEISEDQHRELLAKAAFITPQPPSAYTLQAQYDLELAILALHSGDTAEAVIRAQEAIKFDPGNVLARQTRAMLHLLETSTVQQYDEESEQYYSSQSPQPNYVEAMNQMRAVNKPLLLRISTDVVLRHGSRSVATARQGDVLQGSEIIDYGNQKWLTVTGIQRKGKATSETEKTLGVITLADLSKIVNSYDNLQEFDSRNRQPGYLVRGGYGGGSGNGGGGERATAALGWTQFGLSFIRGGGWGGGWGGVGAGAGGGGAWRGYVPNGGGAWRGYVPYGGGFY